MYHLIGKSNKRHSLFKTRPTLNCFTKTILHLRKVFYSLNASLCDVLIHRTSNEYTCRHISKSVKH